MTAMQSTTESLTDPEDIGVPIYKSRREYLKTVPLEHLSIPWYKGDIWLVVKIVGYIAFRRNMDEKNKGVVVTRSEMDAAWLKTVRKKFDKYVHPKAATYEEGSRALKTIVEWKKMLVTHAIGQMIGLYDLDKIRETRDQIEAYWAKKEGLQPGSGVENSASHVDNVKFAQKHAEEAHEIASAFFSFPLAIRRAKPAADGNIKFE